MPKLLVPMIFLLTIVAVALGQVQEARVQTGCNVEFAKFLVDQQAAESKSVAETDKRIRIHHTFGRFYLEIRPAGGAATLLRRTSSRRTGSAKKASRRER